MRILLYDFLIFARITVDVFHKERMSPLGVNMPPAEFSKAFLVFFAGF